MKKLIAKRPVLYQGREYRRGEALPAQDSRMVDAWLRAGSAAWDVQESEREEPVQESGQAEVPQEPEREEPPREEKKRRGGGSR